MPILEHTRAGAPCNRSSRRETAGFVAALALFVLAALMTLAVPAPDGDALFPTETQTLDWRGNSAGRAAPIE